MKVAVLFCDPKGTYSQVPDVELWDERRDARKYAGPWPVVAHPPCARWCRLAGLVEKRWGHKKGDDGGCFESALLSLRRWGGVLEHPAYSDAFAHFGLPIPKDKGGWQRGICGGWSCHVEQWHYGHKAKKATWLYAYGVSELPSLRWGATPDNETVAHVGPAHDGNCRCTDCLKAQRTRPALVERWSKRKPKALISWCSNHVASGEVRERLGKKAASATPPPSVTFSWRWRGA